MKPDPAAVIQWRTLAVWIMRAAAVAMLVTGAYLSLKRLFFGLVQFNLELVLLAYEGLGETHSFYRGLAMMAVGAVLGLLAPRLARWMIVLPSEGCPRCGYPGGGRDGKCPECGLPLGPSPAGEP